LSTILLLLWLVVPEGPGSRRTGEGVLEAPVRELLNVPLSQHLPAFFIRTIHLPTTC